MYKNVVDKSATLNYVLCYGTFWDMINADFMVFFALKLGTYIRFINIIHKFNLMAM